MHPLLTEMLARDHRRALLAEATRYRLSRQASAPRPLRTAVTEAFALARRAWSGRHRARRSTGLADCACASAACR